MKMAYPYISLTKPYKFEIPDTSNMLSNYGPSFSLTERLDQLNSICTSDTLPRHCTLDKDECIYPELAKHDL